MPLSKSSLVVGQVLTVKPVLKHPPLPIKFDPPLPAPTEVNAWSNTSGLGTGAAYKLRPGQQVTYVKGPFKSDGINIIEVRIGTQPAYIYWCDARTNLQ